MTDIIERSPMHNEDQLLKVADVIMALIRPAFRAEVLQIIEENSVPVPADQITDQITDYMQYNFDISDHFEFDIHEHEYEIGSMIGEHIDEREEDDDKFKERVTDVLKDITVGFDIK